MDIEIRPIQPDELPELARVFGTVFGERWPSESIDDMRRVFEFDRSICGFDAGAMVATGGAFTFQLAVPAAPRSAPAG